MMTSTVSTFNTAFSQTLLRSPAYFNEFPSTLSHIAAALLLLCMCRFEAVDIGKLACLLTTYRRSARLVLEPLPLLNDEGGS
jgi:hypothetical protein